MRNNRSACQCLPAPRRFRRATRAASPQRMPTRPAGDSVNAGNPRIALGLARLKIAVGSTTPSTSTGSGRLGTSTMATGRR